MIRKTIYCITGILLLFLFILANIGIIHHLDVVNKSIQNDINPAVIIVSIVFFNIGAALALILTGFTIPHIVKALWAKFWNWVDRKDAEIAGGLGLL